jgi:N-acetylmuramoyl-L-alanine amidase
MKQKAGGFFRVLVSAAGLWAASGIGCKSDLVDRGSYVADLSRNAKGREPRIRYLVLHYTALDDAQSLSVLTADAVSVHYLVMREPFKREGHANEKPYVYALVPENERAWHAGLSHWQRASDLNDSSIGIEISNRGPLDADWHTWDRFDDAQIEAVTRLAHDIITRYGISPTRVVGHADIAPQRKQDPGPVFPWERLAKAGIGAWPDPADVTTHLAGRHPRSETDLCMLQYRLFAYGYDIPMDGALDERTRRVLQAFQMHFRPADYAGNPDAETDAIVAALLDKYVKRGASSPDAQIPIPCRPAPPAGLPDGGGSPDGGNRFSPSSSSDASAGENTAPSSPLRNQDVR